MDGAAPVARLIGDRLRPERQARQWTSDQRGRAAPVATTVPPDVVELSDWTDGAADHHASGTRA